MLKRNSANEDELDHTRARQAVAPNFMHPRALKLQPAIDLPRRFLNMFDNTGQLKQTIARRHTMRSNQWRLGPRHLVADTYVADFGPLGSVTASHL
ncbi:hypothetical protein [Bradyrhizobium sp. B120]|uniref:hypothetical protein n=1 Tax=Bradyrhizobium sp. B120 TaxID=3410088 RepID=UPI003B9813EC